MTAASTPAETLAQALVAFQAESPTFTKNKTAKVRGESKKGTPFEYTYKYAALGDILPVVGPLLAKHGLAWNSKPGRDDDGELVLRYKLLHRSGEADYGEMPLGVDRHCKPQELGSAITYARRYAITAHLNLTTDEDDDGQTANAAERSGPAWAPAETLVNAQSIVELQAASKGLSTSGIKLAFTACGIPVPNPLVWNVVPQAKAADMCKALASAERKS